MTTAIGLDKIPADCVGLRLHRILSRDRLQACEAVIFAAGRPAVLTTLQRGAVAGRVDVGGEIKDHFADCLNADGDWSETVALDAKSYRSLKERWMRCKVESCDQ